MRKIALILLAGVLALSAVEWEVKQVTESPDRYSFDPLLVLDEEGYARVLFQQFNDRAYLKVASNATGSWVIKDIPKTTNDYSPGYSLDVDPSGNTVVAFVEWRGPMGEYTDIFLATDSSGEFLAVNITDDEAFQSSPVVKLDHEGIPHFVYTEYISETETQLFHGWVGLEGLHSEQVTENLYQDGFVGYDLVFDPLHISHVFYIGDDDHLWHTTSGEPAWIAEPLNDLSSEWPSAVADPLGSFHVAYDAGANEVHYITNMTGTWQDEVVSALGVPEAVNEKPSLALETVYGGYLGIGNPHVVWMHADAVGPYDLYYARRPEDSWLEEPVLDTPEKDELTGYGHYFAVDVEAYGHLVYCADDENYMMQVFYAKSTTPLIDVSIDENSPKLESLSLEVRGSTIHFSLHRSGTISLDLYDAAGRRVRLLASGVYNSGQHVVPINSAGLTAGVYFVHLESTNLQASAKFVLTR
jgi:hypothetical protein